MKKSDHVIVGIHVHNRTKHAVEVQRILTAFGGDIRTRLGLHHDVGAPKSKDAGLILVELIASHARAADFVRQLEHVPGVDVQQMIFPHAG